MICENRNERKGTFSGWITHRAVINYGRKMNQINDSSIIMEMVPASPNVKIKFRDHWFKYLWGAYIA